MASPRKPSSKELDARKIAGEVRLHEIAARRVRLERKYQLLQRNQIKNADKLAQMHREALRLAELEHQTQEDIVASRSKLGSVLQNQIRSWKDELIGPVTNFLKKELSITNQLNFVWERVRHGAELYGKMQGSLPALTGKQLSEIEKLNKRISEGGISAKTALDIFESMPNILKDVTKAAKSVAYQQFLMAEAARDTALRYGKTYDEVRNLQKTVQQTLAIRVVDKGTRKDVEMVTDSLLYMEDRGIMPVADALKYTTKLSRQFGVGTTAAVEDSAIALEKLSRIPDTLSDRMKKAEGMVGRFAATNREDFLRTVLELNEAYGSQSTILKNVGATFAQLTMEARKYGAQAETASRVAKGLSSALVENQQDSHIAFLAGEKLAERLRTEPALFAKMTAGMSKEMIANVQTAVEQGGLGFADLSKVFASTTEGMAERLRVIRDIYGGKDLAVTARLLSSIPGLDLKTTEEKWTAARMLTEGKGAEEIITTIQNLQRASEKDSQAKRKAEEKTLEATHAIGEPLRAVETRYKAAKEIGFRETAEALNSDAETNINRLLDILSSLTKSFGGLNAAVIGMSGATLAANIGLAAVGLTSKSIKGVSKILATSGGLLAKALSAAGIGGAAVGGTALVGALGAAYLGQDLLEEQEAMNDRVQKRMQENKEEMKTASEAVKKAGQAAREKSISKLYEKLTPEQKKLWDRRQALREKNIPFNTSAPPKMAQLAVPKSEKVEKPFKDYTNVNTQVTATANPMNDMINDFIKKPNIGGGKVMSPNTGGPKAPIVTQITGKNMVLNPDGSANVKTVLDILIPGFADAVVNAQAQAGASKRYGG